MRKLPLALLALCGGIALTTATAVAQDSAALVELLVKKGLINDQEAEDVRAELIKENASTPAGKLSLGSHVTEFKLGGDVRVRHQYDATTSQGAGTSLHRNRERFRFRFNGDAKLAGGWGAGFALETANAADSGNQTLENGNADYNIYLARAYVSWQANENLSLVGGKFKNPFQTTDLVWDGDINPQGLSETYDFRISEGSLQLRAGQFVMDDNDERKGSGPSYRDSFLFAQQLVYTNKLSNGVSVTVAPGYMFYNNASITGNNNETAFDGRTKGLSIATFSGSVKFPNVGANTLSLYWDSSYNFDADTRVHDIYGLSDSYGDGATAWLVGLGYAKGKGKDQGDWSVKLDYRRIGIGALDPNLSDSDFAFGHMNQQGIKLGGSYNVTSFASIGLTYFYTWDVQKSLKHAVAGLDKSSILQLDLVTKF
ncbi:MAG TPA: putative porin [Opitutaceae bacterium]|nr:putative porin [Opitutaceae bacterium]